MGEGARRGSAEVVRPTVVAVGLRGMDNNIYTQIGIVLIIAIFVDTRINRDKIEY